MPKEGRGKPKKANRKATVKDERKPNYRKPDVTNLVSGKEMSKYSRGKITFNSKKVKGTALRAKLEMTNTAIKEAAAAAAATEVLLPATAGFIELEDKDMKVYKLKQRDILQHVDTNTAKNAFDFQLHEFGPYRVNFTRNGR